MQRVPLLLALLCMGCVITNKTVVKTGLFDDDLKKLSDAYEVVDKMELGKSTFEQVEGVLGKNFNRAKNVELVPGAAVFRKVFGDNVFHGAGVDEQKRNELTKEMKQYRAFLIPYKDITTHIDRWYFSNKETIKQGDDLLILVMFKKDKLFYSDFKYVKIDSKESTRAFAQGLIDIIKEFLGPTDAFYDLVDRLKGEFEKK